MHFDRRGRMRLSAATALPQVGQFIGQGNRAAIFTDHRAEALEQLERHRLRRLHHHAAHLLEHRLQELGARLAKALVYGCIAHRHRPHLSRRSQLL
jgi:hypothetical protein